MVRIRRRKALLFFSRMIKYTEVFYHSSLPVSPGNIDYSAIHRKQSIYVLVLTTEENTGQATTILGWPV
jgi:hypothetical protein